MKARLGPDQALPAAGTAVAVRVLTAQTCFYDSDHRLVCGGTEP